jgi:hypothetical protein
LELRIETEKEDLSPEWKTQKLPLVSKYLTPESSPPKLPVALPGIKDLELPLLIPYVPTMSDMMMIPHKQDEIYIQNDTLYFNGLSFQRDDRMFLFDSGIKYSVKLLHVGKEDMTFQRTDGSKTHVSIGLLIDGRVRLSPK